MRPDATLLSSSTHHTMTRGKVYAMPSGLDMPAVQRVRRSRRHTGIQPSCCYNVFSDVSSLTVAERHVFAPWR